jgi:hypothetical protein
LRYLGGTFNADHWFSICKSGFVKPRKEFAERVGLKK